MSSWFEQAEERLEREYKEVKGTKETAMKGAVRDTLLEFCRQDEEFAQAVAQGGSFQDCMKAVAMQIYLRSTGTIWTPHGPWGTAWNTVRCYGRTSCSLPMTRPWKSWRTKTRRRKPGI